MNVKNCYKNVIIKVTINIHETRIHFIEQQNTTAILILIIFICTSCLIK